MLPRKPALPVKTAEQLEGEDRAENDERRMKGAEALVLPRLHRAVRAQHPERRPCGERDAEKLKHEPERDVVRPFQPPAEREGGEVDERCRTERQHHGRLFKNGG